MSTHPHKRAEHGVADILAQYNSVALAQNVPASAPSGQRAVARPRGVDSAASREATTRDCALEFEIRFQSIDVKAFAEIYRMAQQKFAPIGVECSVSAISKEVYGLRERGHDRHAATSYIRKITFRGHTSVGNEFYTKAALAAPRRVRDSVDYTANLSRETPVAKFDTHTNAMVRFKMRASWQFGSWRLDLTASKESVWRDVQTEIRNLVSVYFPPEVTMENFLERVNYDMVDRYECELEWTGGPPITQSDVDSAVREVAGAIADVGDIAYHNAIYEIAEYIAPNRHALPMFKRQHGLKQLLNQPVALNKNVYLSEIFPPNGYFATDKADGTRGVLVVYAHGCRVVADALREYGDTGGAPIAIADGEFFAAVDADAASGRVGSAHVRPQVPAAEADTDTDAAGADGAPPTQSATDAEAAAQYLPQAAAARSSDRMYLFDAMMAGGKTVVSSDYESRCVHLNAIAKSADVYLDCRVKKIVKLAQATLRENLEAVYSPHGRNADASHIVSHASAAGVTTGDSAAGDSAAVSVGLSASFGASATNYDIDGIILTEPNRDYYTTKNYKWKPLEHTTIDFTAVRCPPTLLGRAPYTALPGHTLYLLFVGISHTMRCRLGIELLHGYKRMFADCAGEYYPIQFSPSIDKYAYIYQHPQSLPDIDYKIVELGIDMPGRQGRGADATDAADAEAVDTESVADAVAADVAAAAKTAVAITTASAHGFKWRFVRVRTDRKYERTYYGNDFRIAEITYMNYVDPFGFDDLITPRAGYFESRAPEAYGSGNAYRRFVISALIKRYLSGATWIIDEAAGRGGDLHRYLEVGVKNGLFIDSDPTAIAELIRRKYDIFMKRKRNAHSRRGRYAETFGAGEYNVANALVPAAGARIAHTHNAIAPAGSSSNSPQSATAQANSPRSATCPSTVGMLIGTGASVRVSALGAADGLGPESVCPDDFTSMTVYTQVRDLTLPPRALIASASEVVVPGTVDGVVCNFAIHYICDSVDHIRGLLQFNHAMLRRGGVFMFVTMHGGRVFDALKAVDYGSDYVIADRDAPKYTIRRLFREQKLAPFGQRIAVSLPFAGDTREEPIANIDAIVAEAKRVGFTVEASETVAEYLAQFAQSAKKLSDADVEYTKLFQYVVLRKK